VKAAQIYGQEELRQLPDTCFADPVNRYFTIHTPADTLLSAGYFFKQGHQRFPEVVKERLTKAAYAHRIEDHFLALARYLIAPLQKKAATQEASNYALLIKKPNGEVRGRYLVLDSEMLKQADVHFMRNYRKYPIGWRVTIAGNFAKKAEEYGLPVEVLHPVTRAYSGDNHCASERAAVEIVKRGYVCRDLEGKRAYAKLAKLVQGEMHTKEARADMAAVVDKLDRATGMDRYYDSHFHDPYKAIFNLTKEAADTVLSILDLGGDQFTRDELERVGLGTYAKILGKDFAKQATDAQGNLSFEKLAAILPTLPRDEKALLVQHLRHVLDSEESNGELLRAVPAA
jgi:hypothetical protein